MKQLKYKYGDIVEYKHMYDTHQGIIWNVYDRGTSISDYTVLIDTQFNDIFEREIIKLTSLPTLDYFNIDNLNVKIFIAEPLRQTIDLLNVISRTDKYDLNILDMLNKVLIFHNTRISVARSMLEIHATNLLSVIKSKHK